MDIQTQASVLISDAERAWKKNNPAVMGRPWDENKSLSDRDLNRHERDDIRAARKLSAIEASQRQIARTLGVDETTVRRDTAANAAPELEKDRDINGAEPSTAANAAPADPPHGSWLPWLESEGVNREIAKRLMALAEAEIVQLALFDSVDAVLKALKGNRHAVETGNDERYTPAHIIEAARACMGGIDLKPPVSKTGGLSPDSMTAIRAAHRDP